LLFARFEVLTVLLLGCDTVSTVKVTNVSEELPALYSVHRKTRTSPKRR